MSESFYQDENLSRRPPSEFAVTPATGSRVFTRHADANKNVGGKWKFEPNNRCLQCQSLVCDCVHRMVSPNSRKKAMMAIETPYDKAKKAKFLAGVISDETASRRSVEHTYRVELGELQEMRRKESRSLELIVEEEAAREMIKEIQVREFVPFRHRFHIMVQQSYLERHQLKGRTLISEERMQQLGSLWDYYTACKELVDLQDNEAALRHYTMEEEYSHRQDLTFYRNELKTSVEANSKQRTQLLKDAFDEKTLIKLEEKEIREGFAQWLRAGIDMIHNHLRARQSWSDNAINQIMSLVHYEGECRMELKRFMENEAYDIHRVLEAKADEQKTMLRYESHYRMNIQQEEVTAFDQIFQENQADYDHTLEITHQKAQQRADALAYTINFLHGIVDQRLQEITAFYRQYEAEYEQRLNWISEKASERADFVHYAVADLREIEVKEDSARTMIFRRMVEDETGVHKWILQKDAERRQWTAEALQMHIDFGEEENFARYGLYEQMKEEENMIAQWAEHKSNEVLSCAMREANNRRDIVVGEAQTRDNLYRYLAQGIASIEESKQQLMAALFHLDSQAMYCLQSIWQEEEDEFQSIVMLVPTSVEAAAGRQEIREQNAFFHLEHRTRNAIIFAEADASATIRASLHEDFDSRRQRMEETLRNEFETILREAVIEVEALWSRAVDEWRAIAAEERVARDDALEMEAARLREEMLARQVTMGEDARDYDDLLDEEPLAEGRMSVANVRMSMCMLDENDDDGLLACQRELILSELPEFNVNKFKPDAIRKLAALVDKITSRRIAQEEKLKAVKADVKKSEEVQQALVRAIQHTGAMHDRLREKQKTDAAEFEQKTAAEKELHWKATKQVRAAELRTEEMRRKLESMKEENAKLRDAIHRKLK